MAGLAAGLVTIPYLARVLRPEAWGQVLLAQGLATWLLLLMEYAFDLSVTRRLAEARGRGGDSHTAASATVPDTVVESVVESVVETVANAITARRLLATAALLFWGGALLALPALRSNWKLAASALLFALARGLTPLWYFLGVERVQRAMAIDTAARVIGALSVFFLVSAPTHGWRVMAAQGATATAAMLLVSRDLHRALPTLRHAPRPLAGGLAVLREGFALFAARASGSLYMQLNTLLIGAVASPVAVAMYGGAERLVRAGVSLLEPATRALVARLSFLHAANAAEAHRLAARLIVGLTAAAAAAAATGAVAAPWIIRLILGPEYDAAVPVFRWLVLLLPIIALATSIGIFSAVPRGHDRIVLLATLSAGVANLLLALPMTRRFGAQGMAGSVVIAEALVAAILVVWYRRQRATKAAA
jgi:PST family polysaccharide transporter